MAVDYCFKCGNEGFDDRKCESCGREPKILNLHMMPEKQVKKLFEASRDIKIPEEYLGVYWSSELFWRYKKEGSQGNVSNLLLERYVNQLQKVHDIFADGGVPSKSAFIIAPSTYSKTTFAYSCMQHALNAGHSVAELLDTMEVKRLLVLASENVKYKLYGRIDYDDYIMSDVLFVTVTKTEYRRNSFMVIQELLSRRSRKGLSTFILSEYSLEVLAEWDNTGNFLRMGQVSRSDNFKKFPSTIMYREGLR